MSKLLHHRHSGKLQPHSRTAYGHLTVLLAMVGVVLGFASPIAQAAVDPSLIPPGFQNPKTGYVAVSASVVGPAPTIAATILSPRNNTSLNESPITVSGICTPDNFVSIYDNGVFAGVTSCTGDGTFSLLSDLFVGKNVFIARISDALSQFGPDSSSVTVIYTPPTTPGVVTDISRTLLIAVDDPIIMGATPGSGVKRSIRISGGQAPYSILWDFGDGETSSVPLAIAGTSYINHAYSKPGRYRVIVRVTDSAGNTGLLELVTVVNGGIAAGTKTIDIPGILFGIWPLYIMAVLLVMTFWGGERRELYILRRRNRLVAGV